jgi:hypothetical protein
MKILRYCVTLDSGYARKWAVCPVFEDLTAQYKEVRGKSVFVGTKKDCKAKQEVLRIELLNKTMYESSIGCDFCDWDTIEGQKGKILIHERCCPITEAVHKALHGEKL